MPRQNAQISVLARNLNFLRRSVDHFLLRRNNLELESVCHFVSVRSDVACYVSLATCGPASVGGDVARNASTRPPSSSPPLPTLPRWGLSYKTPVRECRRTCPQRLP